MKTGNYKFYGRFNQGVVTINLPDVALSSGGDMDKFWQIFDERLELCYRALMCRHNRLKGTLVGRGADSLAGRRHRAVGQGRDASTSCCYGGYSTISLGYAGLCECVRYMTGKPHTDPAATPFALQIMKHMNEALQSLEGRDEHRVSAFTVRRWNRTTYQFAKCLQQRFGIVPGVTDKAYITNSYHVHVTEQIDAFSQAGI